MLSSHCPSHHAHAPHPKQHSSTRSTSSAIRAHLIPGTSHIMQSFHPKCRGISHAPQFKKKDYSSQTCVCLYSHAHNSSLLCHTKHTSHICPIKRFITKSEKICKHRYEDPPQCHPSSFTQRPLPCSPSHGLTLPSNSPRWRHKSTQFCTG